jgi:hypothetical protein
LLSERARIVRSCAAVSAILFLFLLVPTVQLRAVAYNSSSSSLVKFSSLSSAGYAVEAPTGSITFVTGSFVVPSLKCGSGEDAVSMYLVGIGGSQYAAGGTFDCLSGVPTYIPTFLVNSYYGGVPSTDEMKAGDSIEIVVSDFSKQVSISIEDPTEHWDFENFTSASSLTQSVGFYVYEGGKYYTDTPNPDFATLKTSDNSITIRGTYEPLKSFESIKGITIYQYKLVSSSKVVLATTSNFKGSDSDFNVVWKSAG